MAIKKQDLIKLIKDLATLYFNFRIRSVSVNAIRIISLGGFGLVSKNIILIKLSEFLLGYNILGEPKVIEQVIGVIIIIPCIYFLFRIDKQNKEKEVQRDRDKPIIELSIQKGIDRDLIATLQLVIENNGKSIARGIRLQTDIPILRSKFSSAFMINDVLKCFDDSTLVSHLGPGDKEIFEFGAQRANSSGEFDENSSTWKDNAEIVAKAMFKGSGDEEYESNHYLKIIQNKSEWKIKTETFSTNDPIEFSRILKKLDNEMNK